ncbi:uncharacterized protein [Malus domestica]|uniref:uncharacterized protein n=1 Tax=Malus domestica TaxID=3750 RepID=UPI00397555C2
MKLIRYFYIFLYFAIILLHYYFFLNFYLILLHYVLLSSAGSPSDPLLRKLEDAIHWIIVRRSVPDWLPLLPGASYWVPHPRSRSHGLAQLVDKLAKPLSEEETMSMSTVKGWPSSAYFIEGLLPFFRFY